jgi:hypothetical protein
VPGIAALRARHVVDQVFDLSDGVHANLVVVAPNVGPFECRTQGDQGCMTEAEPPCLSRCGIFAWVRQSPWRIT